MKISEIFDTMALGPNLESDAPAQTWLEHNNRQFGQFIDGRMTKPTAGFASINPAKAMPLAEISQASVADIDRAVAAARAAQPGWWALSGHQRARFLYALARQIQKHAKVLSLLETLDNGKPIREARDSDLPLAHRHFYYHAGLAQILPHHMPDARPLGVCAQVIPWNFPLLMLAWKIAPALAAGNTVVLKPAEATSLSALYFAELCQHIGLPPGVVNIITGDGEVGAGLIAHPGIDKIAFTGSTEVGRSIRLATAGSGKELSLELGGKSAFIVCDDADLDSAVEGVVDAVWFNQGEVCCAGSRLLLQEPIAEAFLTKLKARMAKLRLGNPLDKSIDIGAMIDTAARDRVADLIARCERDVFQGPDALPSQGAYVAPTLITDIGPSDPLWQNEIFGPVLVATSFRTMSEAVALANNSRYGLAASLWSENLSRAHEIARKLEAGVIWINSTNMFDAAAPFGGLRESGFGREGGFDGLMAYLTEKANEVTPVQRIAAFEPEPAARNANGEIDQTIKLYIGGKQSRPDGGEYKAVYAMDGTRLGEAPIANRKDLRNAVEAGRAALASWSGATAHLRAQILYYLAENLQKREKTVVASIDRQTGDKTGAEEVSRAIELLFCYAAWADKWDGAVLGVPGRVHCFTQHRPLGVIASFCSNDQPFLGLVAAMAPAIALGNTAILIASEPYPLCVCELYQLLDTSDVPAGVVNLLVGDHETVAPHAAAHMGIDAVWSFSRREISAEIERGSISNLKRVWVNGGHKTSNLTDPAAAQQMLRHVSEVQTFWLPYGD